MLHVQKSDIGWVLAVGNGQVVYAYDKDAKGGTPTCTGSCAQIWVPAAANDMNPRFHGVRTPWIPGFMASPNGPIQSGSATDVVPAIRPAGPAMP